jgi:hypothetical protein
VGGISMGGIAAWNLGMRFWPLFAGAIPLNGALSVWESFGPDRRTRELLPNLLPLPVFAVHGGQDRRIRPDSDRFSAAQLGALGHPALEYVEVPGGDHPLETLGLGRDSPLRERLRRWLRRRRRGPAPATIRHRADHDLGGRAHWVELRAIPRGQSAEVLAHRSAPDRIDLTVTGAGQVALYLTGAAERMTVTVTVNGVAHRVRSEPCLRTVAETFREHADPALVAEQVSTFDVQEEAC